MSKHDRPGHEPRELLFDRMTARLPQVNPGGVATPPLSSLSTRDRRDGVIGLIDAWASALDVLGFQEDRARDETWLETATERRAVEELARSVGHVPAPGSASRAWLAVSVEEGTHVLPKGSAVMSSEAGDGPPPVYETSADLEVRAAWSEMALDVREAHFKVSSGISRLDVRGTNLRLKAGDTILIGLSTESGSEAKVLSSLKEGFTARVVAAVARDGFTELSLDTEWKNIREYAVSAWVVRESARPFGADASPISQLGDELFKRLVAAKHIVMAVGSTTVTRQGAQWRDHTMKTTGFHLERRVPGLRAGSLAVVAEFQAATIPTRTDFTWMRIEGVGDTTASGFGTRAAATRLELKLLIRPSGARDGREQKVEYMSNERSCVRSETRLLLAPEPLVVLPPMGRLSVVGSTLPMQQVVDSALQGRRVLVTGRGYPNGEDMALSVRIDAIEDFGGGSKLTIEPGLGVPWFRDSVRVHANIVEATHGETTREEVLGNGDSLRPWQRYRLHRKPLTWVPSTEPGGVSCSLEVFVDGERWSRRTQLADAGPHDKVYLVRTDEEGGAELLFGDGVHGAIPPTGQENITARYRVGLGAEGAVTADALTLLTDPGEVDFEVRNPLPSSGHAEPESAAELRGAAPRHVRSLERVVSAWDVAEYARNYVGIGLAEAVELQGGSRGRVLLVLGDAAGEPLSPRSDKAKELRAALNNDKTPDIEIILGAFERPPFYARASVRLKTGAKLEAVEGAANAALQEALGPLQRPMGVSLTAAEALAVLTQVEGVAALTLTRFVRADELSTRTAGAGTSSGGQPRFGGMQSGPVPDLNKVDPDAHRAVLQAKPLRMGADGTLVRGPELLCFAADSGIVFTEASDA